MVYLESDMFTDHVIEKLTVMGANLEKKIRYIINRVNLGNKSNTLVFKYQIFCLLLC